MKANSSSTGRLSEAPDWDPEGVCVCVCVRVCASVCQVCVGCEAEVQDSCNYMYMYIVM